jgi:peptidyl-prolyl cis-trans isomerase C
MPRAIAAAVALAAPCFLEPSMLAADAGMSARAGRAVARLGATQSITVAELEERVASMPLFQRMAYGVTPDAIRRSVLTEVLIPDRLLALEADAEHAERDPAVAYAAEQALSGATVRAIRAQVGEASTISREDVRAYYGAHRARYESPERYQVWRILCKTRHDAASVLEAFKGNPTPKAFSDMAREHSEDKATYLRGGNLGFVSEDGSSSFPDFRVDPAIVHVAQTVRDGEFVPYPVAEGSYFSIVWRRGTVAAVHRDVDQVAGAIREALAGERVKEATDRLLRTLRSLRVHDRNDSLLQTADVACTAEADGGAR